MHSTLARAQHGSTLTSRQSASSSPRTSSPRSVCVPPSSVNTCANKVEPQGIDALILNLASVQAGLNELSGGGPSGPAHGQGMMGEDDFYGADAGMNGNGNGNGNGPLPGMGGSPPGSAGPPPPAQASPPTGAASGDGWSDDW
jgi:hypothetical protein